MSNDYGYSSGGGYGAGVGAASTGPKTNSVTPVTIRLIQNLMTSEHDKAKIGDHELKLVTFIAYVLHHEEETKQCLVEDGTGLMSVQLPETILEGQYKDYVRFTGHLQWSKNAYSMEEVGKNEGPILRTYRARQITDHNEISFHLLDTISSYERLKRGSSSLSGYKPMHSSMHADSMSAYSSYRPEVGGDGNEFAGTAEAARQAVLDLFQQLGADSASVPFAELTAQLAGRYSESEVRKACDDLATSGHAVSSDGGDSYMFVA